MLNSETKRHIDAARDVLVGVAPNPTTQIDQITYALIYKFMDDMDQAAVKAGGEPTFFTGELTRYAWSKLTSTTMGNQEKMNLYGEALTKFSEAKQLPELFRTIFRAAFLPYRSPETLGLFLKEISYFDYSHSEELGNAYEYLLSIMSSQGDAGQFRTPRHIIDFMVDVVNPTKNDRVLDPACGTGGFLVSSYNHILEQHDGKDDPKGMERTLTPDERKKLMQNFEGYDIDPTMVRIAQVNMYLHLFKNPKIFQYDTLTSEERWNDKFDVVMANPPFMSPKGGIKPHNKFGIQSNRSEVLFVDFISSHLRPKGRAAIIVPEGIIFQSGKAYKELRKNLVANGLYAVVSLPGGVFQPYSGVKTSILFLNGEIARERSEILFFKVGADGFDLGATKRPVENNDLPHALDAIQSWENGKKIENSLVSFVSKADISKSGDYNLSGDRYKVGIDYSGAKWPLVKIGDVFQIESGGTPSTDNPVYWDGDIPWATLVDIPKEVTKISTTVRKITKEGLQNSSAKIMPRNTVLVSSRATIGRIAVTEVEMATNQGFKNVIVDENNNASYIAYALTFKVQDMIAMASGGTFKEISKSAFCQIEIPLPPLEVQEQIVAELDGYSAIVSGAKQIIENWKPRIDVEPEWEKYELGEVCDVYQPKTITSAEILQDGPHKVYGANGVIGYYTKFNHEDGEVAITCRGATCGTVNLTEPESWITGNAMVVRPKEASLTKQFLYYLLRGTDLNSVISGSAQPQITGASLKPFEIPVPSLDIQEDIVREIEVEKSQVEAARKLMQAYGSRSQATIAKLWNQ